MKWTPPETDFVLPILTILPQKLVGYNEGVSPPVGLRSVLNIQRGANAPRSLSHLPAHLRNADNTHNFLHPRLVPLCLSLIDVRAKGQVKKVPKMTRIHKINETCTSYCQSTVFHLHYANFGV